MKKFSALLVAALFSISMSAGVSWANPATEYTVFTQAGQSYLPLEKVARDLGFATVAADKVVVLSKGNVKIAVAENTNKVQVNYKKDPVTMPLTTQNGVLYIGTAFFSDCLDAAVQMNANGATALVTANEVNSATETMRSDKVMAKEQYNYIYLEKMVEMEDGVKLRTQIYLPEGDGPWPVALARTPYGKNNGDDTVIGREYAKRGMGYIVQHCRGKAGSEGVYAANVDERRDGIATINWLAAQPWCGDIGLQGMSYGGLTSIIYADVLPKKVKAMHYGQYSVDRQLSLYNHGLVRVDVITGWTMKNVPMNVSYSDELYIKSAKYRPQLDMPKALWQTEVPDYLDWVNHPAYHDKYWNQGVWSDLKNVVGKIDIPVTIVAGIFDHHLEGTLEAYNRLKPETRAKSRLLLGNWVHSYNHASATQFPNAKNVGGNMTIDIFNYLYNIVALGNEPQTGIEAYFVEEDQWYALDKWPIETSGSTTFYLSDTTAKSAGKAYALATKPVAKDGTMTYQYDPDNPKLTEGAESAYNTGNLRGSRLLSAPGYRDDVLSFVTAPLTKELTIAGEIKVILFASTDVQDTCFTVTVSEVTPEGKAYNMRNALTTLAYRNDRFGAPQTYTPGEVVGLTITTLPLTWNVKPGNSIRVDISSSNFPEYSIHTNTFGNWAEQTEAVIANQTIYFGDAFPSRVTFPTVKLTDLKQIQ
jgi:putative CocE/NonD family hydrolase